ncbi:NAD(P)H-dependent oxidoreductase [Prevotella sp. PINT]|jgi:Acyl carrier protein phosphodiesterase|uniref:NAD(P)H-dependent oxidoreductase n=1 Tax=Palleniella intestinalis TaxID=2736291 RepID=UPI001554FDF1|nr:NAD(P)H-dependent oxidoreductase [Palleniella intestinalis]NPD81232.1 NAD(P)H-dependent oxidoreductase [Palleniella intestinalis]
MKKLIVIDACMRDGESRTRRILEPLVKELGKRYETETIVLDGEDYQSVGRKVLAERSNGYVPEEVAEQARRIAEADRLVIAAPFWDMSFPAILKVFIENMSLFNITFKDNGTYFEGLCRCEKVLYITTRGMNVRTGDPIEAATPYIKAIGALWGLGELFTVAAENLDYSTPEEIDARINAAIAEGLEICKDF